VSHLAKLKVIVLMEVSPEPILRTDLSNDLRVGSEKIHQANTDKGTLSPKSSLWITNRSPVPVRNSGSQCETQRSE
jgi:hypothetical protein